MVRLPRHIAIGIALLAAAALSSGCGAQPAATATRTAMEGAERLATAAEIRTPARATSTIADEAPETATPTEAAPSATPTGSATPTPAPPSPTHTATATASPSATPSATVAPPSPSPSPSATALPAPTGAPPAVTATEPPAPTAPSSHLFLPAGPVQADPSHHCPTCPKAPAYIVGHVLDAAGNPLPGVRLVCYNEWHRYPVVASKGGGEYDFAIIQAQTTWTVVVLDESDRPISPEAAVPFDPNETCRYILNWQRVP